MVQSLIIAAQSGLKPVTVFAQIMKKARQARFVGPLWISDGCSSD